MSNSPGNFLQSQLVKNVIDPSGNLVTPRPQMQFVAGNSTTGVSVVDNPNLAGGTTVVTLTSTAPGASFGQSNITLTPGRNSNIATSGLSTLRIGLNTPGAFSIGGFTPPAAGAYPYLLVSNTTSQPMTIVNADASSTASWRINTQSNGANVVLQPKQGALLFLYDQSGPGWVLQNVGVHRPRELNVQDFGAIGDDVTDDAAAFNTCISLAQSIGAQVFIPPPTVAYRIYSADISIPSNATIRGAGQLSTINLTNGKKVSLATLAQKITLESFEIQTSDASVSVGLHFQANYFVTCNKLWLTCHSYAGFTTAAVQLEGTAAQNNNAQCNFYELNVEGCTGDGVQIYDELGAAGVQFFGGNIADCHGYGLHQKQRGPGNGLSQFNTYGLLLESNALGNVYAELCQSSGMFGGHIENAASVTEVPILLGNGTGGGVNGFSVRDVAMSAASASAFVHLSGSENNFAVIVEGGSYSYTSSVCPVVKVDSGATLYGLEVSGIGDAEFVIDVPPTVHGISVDLFDDTTIVPMGASSSGFDMTATSVATVSQGQLALSPMSGFFGGKTIAITGSSTTSSTVNVPLNPGWQKTVANLTPSRITVGGATGAGVPIGPNKTAIVRCDGTNVIRVQDDSPTWAPTDISGCVLWLDSSLGVTNSSGVTKWADQSGNAGDVAPNSTIPAYGTATLNGYPGIVGNGTSDALVGTATYSTAKLTVFIVAVEATYSATHVVFAMQTSGHNVNFGRNTNSTNYVMVDDAGSNPGAVTGTNGNPHIYMGYLDGASSYFALDGTAGTTGSMATHTEHVEVLGNPGGSGEYFPGGIYTVIVYNRNLTAAEILTVKTNLGSKYGIPVS